MKIFKVMKFRSNGWNEWHDVMGTFSTKAKAEAEFKRLGLKHNPDPKSNWPNLWTDYIDEVEID